MMHFVDLNKFDVPYSCIPFKLSLNQVQITKNKYKYCKRMNGKDAPSMRPN